MLCTLTVNQFPCLTLDMKIQRTISRKEMSNTPLNPQSTYSNGFNLILLQLSGYMNSSSKSCNRHEVEKQSIHIITAIS